MLLPFAVAVCGATLGTGFAFLSVSFARAPGWEPLRRFALIAVTAALFCASFAIQLSTREDGTVVALARVDVALAAIHVMGWIAYSGVTPRPLARGLHAAALLVAVLALVPHALVSEMVVRQPDAWTHSDNVNVRPTLPGVAGFGVLLVLLAFPLLRYVSHWRAREPGAGAHLVAVGALAFTGFLEGLDAAWGQTWPRLIPVGFMIAVASVGGSLARRFVRSARAYQTLSRELDATVARRTAELSRALAENLRLEKLAALGSLSSAVAHEVNNPAAAASANIRYLIDAVTEDGAPPDLLDVLKDANDSIDRVAGVVTQLAFAGDRATRSPELAPLHVADAVRRASADAHAEVPPGVRVSMEVPDGLYAAAEGGTVRQTVTALVVSALDAMKAAQCTGTVHVRGSREGDLVVLRVVDPCPVTDFAQLERRLDPFLSSRPVHVARGVGLAVSIALLRILGGTLALEHGGSDGTTVRLTLPAAAHPREVTRRPSGAPASRARVLLVDDDVLVRISLRRLLGREYSILEAGGVDEALARVREHPGGVDAIVCDLVMPQGGAKRLFEELDRIEPELVAATALMTGGAVDGETQAFANEHADRM
jgi:signal transduction histidine kinase/CheY-like chemotaxis protein